MTLRATIRSIQDLMRGDPGVDGDAQRLGQLTWMLFLKIVDDNCTVRSSDCPIPKRLRWHSWTVAPRRASELLAFVNQDLFPGLRKLKSRTAPELSTLIRSVFSDTHNYMKSASLLQRVVVRLNELDFRSANDRHTVGDIYEHLLRDLQSAGNAGEFYTPRAITQFMVDATTPGATETVLDPACGTGGFLVSVIHHLRTKCTSPEVAGYAQARLRGVEKKPLPYILCLTNLMFHGVNVPSMIRKGNLLEEFGTEKEGVDIVLTNPPFWVMLRDYFVH